MSFFDNVVDTMSKAAREVSDGAKNIAEKNRVRKEIATMENEIRTRFRAIGQKYYDDMSEHPDPAYAELVNGITQLKEQLAAKQKELVELDGVIVCPGCGKGCDKNAKFCPACGTAMPKPAAEATKSAAEAAKPVNPTNCTVCNAPLSPSALFCAECGTKVEPIVPTVEAEPAAPEQPAVCACCGAALAPEALFCAECGTKAPDVQ